MIKIICCDHFLNMLIEKKSFFKFSRSFHGDCKSHTKTIVVKCSHKKFFVDGPENFDENCSCDYKKYCGSCITKLFMLNHMVCKVCVVPWPSTNSSKALALDEYLEGFKTKPTFFLMRKLMGLILEFLDKKMLKVLCCDHSVENLHEINEINYEVNSNFHECSHSNHVHKVVAVKCGLCRFNFSSGFLRNYYASVTCSCGKEGKNIRCRVYLRLCKGLNEKVLKTCIKKRIFLGAYILQD